MQSKGKTKILVECALMIALSTVLSKLEIPLWLQGGSITAASMLPIILVSFRHGTRWGLLTALMHSLLQMFMGFSNVLYCKTLGTQFLCILLDYVLAFTALGLAAAIGALAGKGRRGIAFGTISVCFIRFVCSFLSGIFLWGEYAAEGVPVWLHSLIYNGGYMLPETLLTLGAALLLHRLFERQQA